MSYRIAVASSDGKAIDRHFGHSDGFVIVFVEADGTWRVETRRESTSPCQHGSHDDGLLDAVGRLLSDCRYVLVEAIGPGASRVVKSYGCTPLEVQDETIESAVPQLIAYDRRAHPENYSH